MIFYNPKVSAIKFELSIIKSTVQVEIAPALNPGAQGRPAPGTKVYDWDNSGYFSISPEEAVKLVYFWDKIRKGEYTDPNASKPEYANQYTITHYSGGQGNKSSNHMSFKAAEMGGKLTGSVTMTLHKGDSKTSFFYPLRKEEQVIVKSFFENGYKDLPYHVALLEAIEKKKYYDKMKASQNNNQTGNYNQNKSQPQSQPTGEFVPSPSNQVSSDDPFGDVGNNSSSNNQEPEEDEWGF